MLRGVVSLELLINAVYYANHPYLVDKSTRYQEQTKKIIFDISFSLEAFEKLPSSLTSVERYVKAVINKASINCKD